jgi:hypothetical protein
MQKPSELILKGLISIEDGVIASSELRNIIILNTGLIYFTVLALIDL